jgi:hypothetical protein
MFIRKSRLQLGNLVTSDAKRLLQHNLPQADIASAVQKQKRPPQLAASFVPDSHMWHFI